MGQNNQVSEFHYGKVNFRFPLHKRRCIPLILETRFCGIQDSTSLGERLRIIQSSIEDFIGVQQKDVGIWELMLQPVRGSPYSLIVSGTVGFEFMFDILPYSIRLPSPFQRWRVENNKVPCSGSVQRVEQLGVDNCQVSINSGQFVSFLDSIHHDQVHDTSKHDKYAVESGPWRGMSVAIVGHETLVDLCGHRGRIPLDDAVVESRS